VVVVVVVVVVEVVVYDLLSLSYIFQINLE